MGVKRISRYASTEIADADGELLSVYLKVTEKLKKIK